MLLDLLANALGEGRGARQVRFRQPMANSSPP
jgi:hypothetical protein